MKNRKGKVARVAPAEAPAGQRGPPPVPLPAGNNPQDARQPDRGDPTAAVTIARIIAIHLQHLLQDQRVVPECPAGYMDDVEQVVLPRIGSGDPCPGVAILLFAVVGLHEGADDGRFGC